MWLSLPCASKRPPCDAWHSSFHRDGNRRSLHPDVSHPELCPTNVLPYSDVSHPEFFSPDIPPGCLTSGIMPDHVLPYPDVSHLKFFSVDIPPGCLTSGILPGHRSTLSGCLTFEIFLRRHSTRMSHTRNSAPPTFNIPPRYLTFGILPGQRSTFSGYLTSGILSDRRSTFFFILRAFSLGSKITFLIKLCCHFYF